MRRPAQTRAQKQHAREQRALLRLRRAAVKYSAAGDQLSSNDTARDTLAMALADLGAACDHYAEVIPLRELRRLSR